MAMKRKTTRKKGFVRARRNGKRVAKVSQSRPAPIAFDDLLDALVAAQAQTLGLSVDPAWRDGVKFNLGLIFRLGALVDNFPLPDESEPGPVFHA